MMSTRIYSDALSLKWRTPKADINQFDRPTFTAPPAERGRYFINPTSVYTDTLQAREYLDAAAAVWDLGSLQVRLNIRIRAERAEACIRMISNNSMYYPKYHLWCLHEDTISIG